MKKIILSCVLFFVVNSILAQDNIVFRNGDETKGKVLEVADSLVKFKPADNPDGPVYSYRKSEILFIKYENGKKDTFNEQKNELPDYKIVYEKHLRITKTDSGTFSFMVRTGYEYTQFNDASNYNNYNYQFPPEYTKNNFFLNVIAGKRKLHYQYGGGFGFYFQDVKTHFLQTVYNNINGSTTMNDIHSHTEGIGLELFFANKVYLLDKKFTPFIAGDVSLAIDNIIPVRKDNNSYYYNNGSIFLGSNNPYPELMLGAGIEMKTNSKSKWQMEIGLKLNSANNNDGEAHGVLHTGLSFVF